MIYQGGSGPPATLWIRACKNKYISLRYHAVVRTYFSWVLLDFSLTVKAATLIFISGCGSAISSAKEGKSGFTYNLVKS